MVNIEPIHLKEFYIRANPYKAKIKIVEVDYPEDYILKENICPTVETGYAGYVYADYIHKDYDIIVILKPKLAINIIAHEVFHIVCAVMRRAGVLFSEDSEEAYAYLLDYLLVKVLNGLNNTKKED